VLLPAVLAAVIFAPNWLFTAIIAMLGVFGLYEIAAMTGTLKLVGLPLYATVGGVPLLGQLYGGDIGWLIPAIVIVLMLILLARIAFAGSEGAPSVPALAFTPAPRMSACCSPILRCSAISRTAYNGLSESLADGGK